MFRSFVGATINILVCVEVSPGHHGDMHMREKGGSFMV